MTVLLLSTDAHARAPTRTHHPRLLSWQPSPANKNIPLLMGHGTSDNVIPFSRAKQSFDRLQVRMTALIAGRPLHI